MKIIIPLLTLLVLFSGCIISDYFFSNTIELPESLCDKIEGNKVIILYQNNTESQEIIDNMKILEQEYDINFLYIDLTKDIDEDKLKQIKLLTKGKPAVIIGCNVFLGSQTIETYRNALDEINR